MVHTDLTVARLRLANDQAQALQRGLLHRQIDLLSLEESLRQGLPDRVVIDQAEDIRRAVDIHTTGQVEEVRAALDHAASAIGETAERGLSAYHARRFAQLVNVAGEEALGATKSLQDVGQKLSRISQRLPGEPHLAEAAQKSIDQAAGRLENARRAVFRVVEDLPVITRAVEELPESDPAGQELDVSIQPSRTAQRSLGDAAEKRRRWANSKVASAGIAPGR
jgi:hypothetical protein